MIPAARATVSAASRVSGRPRPRPAAGPGRAGARPYTRRVIAPSLVFGILVGLFWTGAYVLARGSAGGRLPLVVLAAILGAWAGDALGGRLGIDLVRIGDFRLVAASAGAGVGIGLVALLALLGPSRAKLR